MYASWEGHQKYASFLKEEFATRAQGANFVFIFGAVEASLLSGLRTQHVVQIIKTALGS